MVEFKTDEDQRLTTRSNKRVEQSDAEQRMFQISRGDEGFLDGIYIYEMMLRWSWRKRTNITSKLG